MHWFSYLLPILTTLVLFLLRKDYENYPYYLATFAVATLLLGIVQWLVRYADKSKEYLSGFVTQVEHYNAWTEQVVYYETVKLPNGGTRSVRRVRYVYHPEYWQWVLNTGITSSISHSTYNYWSDLWSTPEERFSTFHVNCVSGGGGQRYLWDNEKNHCRTVTYTGRYTNPLKHSNSIFRFQDISKQQAQELKLYDYPDIEQSEQNVILGKDVQVSELHEFQYINAIYGLQHQIHVFILLFDASEHHVTVAEQQRAYWQGGNKNEFTICLGIEGEERLVKWCSTFSWMDEPTLGVATEGYFLELIGQPLQLGPFAEWFHEHIDLWKRKEFKDFKYLNNKMQPWQLATMFLAAGADSYGIWWFLTKHTLP